MDSITQYLTAIANELANDPANLGYKGLTADQQATLMNNPYTIMVSQIQTPRLAQIISQIPFAPNAVTAQDIQNSTLPITAQAVSATAAEIGVQPNP